MPDTQLYCPSDARKAVVRAEGALNGIEYLEVLDNEIRGSPLPQQTLLAHCFRPVTGLGQQNVRIDGGVRVRNVHVVWAFPANAVPTTPADLLAPPERAYIAALTHPERVLVVRTDSPGDFSTYTLRLVNSPSVATPPAGFDTLLATVDFSFKVDCPSDFDCAPPRTCTTPVSDAPPLNYLAKDYASFRRLMLDRLALLVPEWREDSAADLGITLVEVLAYAADHLSYEQDAIASEAYLGTARRRASVRRHARLVDYPVHEGSNARAWIAFEVQGALLGTPQHPVLPRSTLVLSPGGDRVATVRPSNLARALSTQPVVFETLEPAVLLKESRNAISFYTWRDPDCCLPRGATRATLVGSAAELALHAGDVLIFEEVRGPDSGRAEDADPLHRHVVRLDAAPLERTDPPSTTPVLDISWYAEDALPFSMCLREVTVPGGGTAPVSVARANVVLADHGLTVPDEPLVPDQVPAERRYRPLVARRGLTQAMPFDRKLAQSQPAATVTRVVPESVRPAIEAHGEFQAWSPQRDLLSSGRFAPDFVVETEDDGRAYLRFGDDVLGRRPAPGARFTATYRVGTGPGGNVGAEALARVVTDVDGIRAVRNPLPAVGGTAPESIERVRLNAPEAFRAQQRAVTADDYALAAQTHPRVLRGAASRRWTGSWYTWFVTLDRVGGQPVDAVFRDDAQRFLDRFRLAGYDLEIDGPVMVALDIKLSICVASDYIRANVRQALLDAFGSVDGPSGRGFFHPDNFTFGQPVYLSRVLAKAMAVPGVVWVQPVRFQRWGGVPEGELVQGALTPGRLEIARLDNDPNAPENGRLELDMQGGL